MLPLISLCFSCIDTRFLKGLSGLGDYFIGVFSSGITFFVGVFVSHTMHFLLVLNFWCALLWGYLVECLTCCHPFTLISDKPQILIQYFLILYTWIYIKKEVIKNKLVIYFSLIFPTYLPLWCSDFDNFCMLLASGAWTKVISIKDNIFVIK